MKELLAQIKKGEGQETEFKTSFQKEAIETVVAFANAKGGKVFIGVDDNGTITGVKLQKENLQNWLNQIKLTTSPTVIPNVSVEEIDNKKIVIIEVKEYPIKPINYKHKYLIRQANANHVMSMEEIANEYLKTKNSSWDYYVDTTQNFNDISLEKVEQFIQKVEINLGKKFTDPPMQVLQKYGLIRDDKLTYGGYLLFVKNFCLISGIQAGRFKTSIDIIDSISLNTDIFTEIDELLIFLRKHFMVEYIITGNPQREERYDYPLDAIREIVLNMIIHRDYRDSSDSIIKIFDDRIEFYNPGELYDGLTVEQLVSNNYTSKTRNKLIALIFKECGLIEKYGSGIDRIKRYCKAHRLKPPKFEEMQKGFRVTVYKEDTQKTEIPEKDGGVNGGVILIYEIIEKTPNLKAKQIADALNIPLRTVERELKALKNQDKIRFKGAPKTGGYYVK